MYSSISTNIVMWKLINLSVVKVVEADEPHDQLRSQTSVL